MSESQTMRAWLFSTASGGLEKNLSLHEDAPRPPSDLAKDELLIKVISMSVNPVDCTVPELGIVSKAVISTPASPGIDFCGKVVATGSTVDTYKVDELVFGKLDRPSKFGSLAEYIVAAEHCIAPLPEGVDVHQAATIGVCGQTQYQAISRNVKKGDKIFINGGSGGTGSFGIQIGKALGCQVTTSCSTNNVEFCKSLGADEVIDYSADDVVRFLRQEGQQYDLVVDNIGAPENLYHECHDFLKPSGRFVQVGVKISLAGTMNMASRALLPGFLGGGKRGFEFMDVKNSREDKQQLASWIASGTVKPVIQEVVEFESAVKAYEMLKTGRTKGKIVVQVSKQ